MVDFIHLVALKYLYKHPIIEKIWWASDFKEPNSQFDMLHQNLGAFGHLFWPLSVCTMRKSRCAGPLEKLHCVQVVCAPRLLCALRSWVYAPRSLKSPPTPSNAHNCTLTPLQRLSKACKSTMPLIWMKTCIYSLGRDGFNFCFLENPFF